MLTFNKVHKGSKLYSNVEKILFSVNVAILNRSKTRVLRLWGGAKVNFAILNVRQTKFIKDGSFGSTSER